VVLVHGTADALVPIERAREIKAALQHAYLAELPGIGHMPMMEKPQETAEALKKLL
jgi:pimeloyl-ACP methyl ester carboxylesterase